MSENEITLKVEGMTCSNCAAGISKSLKKNGFKNTHASFSEGEVSFALNGNQTKEEAIDQIKSLGYKIVEADLAKDSRLSQIERKFLFSLLFSLPLLLHMFVGKDSWLNLPMVQITLATPVFLLGLAHFGKSAWGSIKGGMANMDVLIFVGSSSAFVYSLVGTLLSWGSPQVHQYMFFETAAMIVTVVLMGNVIEQRAVKKTSEQLGELTKLQTSVARIVMRLGKKEKFFETEPKNVKLNDELQINEGEHVPVDGVIISGEAQVDESAITGESELISKSKGDTLFSGTTLFSGNCRVKALARAKDSTLEKIIDLVKRARRDQPAIQILGDKVSSIFVPVVLGISSLTFIVSYLIFDLSLTTTIMNSIAVLVISCPCAMGLATPTAVVAGIGKAAKKGILIKGGSTLERLAKAEIAIFDKTGTLTTGNFAFQFEENQLGDRAQRLIKSLEAHSSHPLARSFTSFLRDYEPVELKAVVEKKGRGMSAETIDGEQVFFGIDTKEESDLVLELDNTPVCRVNVKDKLKHGAREMIKYFHDTGIKTIILSGDREEKVVQAAESLAIEEFHFRMRPEEKLEFIQSLSENKNVIMVGDGINDGPALSLAQVGISHGGASSLAIDSARVVLMRSDEMDALIDAVKVSKETYKTIKQNLFWAFFYNILAIPVAAVGLLNPMIAALSMAFSDVIVIGNSLRLKIRSLK
ncbi:MAG: cadmium-translocating P-type ATPase [Flavobacteriales bacterium]|nr:cadmium-translocating P-type ATPase [Flavobacteriales bacterium]